MTNSEPNPNSRAPFVDGVGRLTKYGQDIISKVYRALELSGAGSILDNMPSALISPVIQNNEDSRPLSTQIADYTTIESEAVLVGASITISLNESPNNGERVSVKSSGDYDITVDGNGRNIDGESSAEISLSYDSREFVYYIDSNQWHIVTGFSTTETAKFEKLVQSAADLVSPSSSISYKIDGQINLGSAEIVPPAGGLTISGLGFNISKLFSTEDNYTMFNSANAGDVFIAGQGVTLSASGANSKVLGLTNGSGFSAVEFNFVNFEDCTEIGFLEDYRQLLMRNVGVFDCDDGLEFVGNWIGGARIIDFIVRTFGSTGTIFKKGAGLAFGTRFSITPNISLGSGASSVADFEEANFSNDSSFQINGGFIERNGALDINDANYFPNIDETNIKSYWVGNTGIKNTVIGGAWECTSETATTVGASSTYYKLEGTTTAEGLDHADSPADNRIRLLTSEPKDLSVIASVKVEQAVGFGDEVNLRLRIWRDATSSFDEGRTVAASIPNLTSLDNVVSIALIDRITLNQNDYCELWISNESGSGNLIMKTGSFFQARRT